MKQIDITRVKAALTMSGTIPDGYAFLCEGLIYRWDPRYDFGVMLLEDNELAQDCRDYLESANKKFASLDQAVAKIIEEKWLGWERLLAPPDTE
jgi:hypothetical protein